MILTKIVQGMEPGTVHGRWTILGPAFMASRWRVVVQCDCGNVAVSNLHHVRSGASSGCGCDRMGKMQAARVTHGDSKSHLYRVWKGMRERCSYPRHKGWKNYGGRGIRVCDEWEQSFEAFRDWALANGWRRRLTIDREDNDGPYSPENCRVVPHIVNCNNKSGNLLLAAFGETKTLSEWGRDTRCAVTLDALNQRIRLGWDIERALTEPSRETQPRCYDLIRAFGEEKSANAWGKDARCLVSPHQLVRRIRDHGMEPEVAMSIPSGKVTRRRLTA